MGGDGGVGHGGGEELIIMNIPIEVFSVTNYTATESYLCPTFLEQRNL